LHTDLGVAVGLRTAVTPPSFLHDRYNRKHEADTASYLNLVRFRYPESAAAYLNHWPNP
jgi:hypothetical protein